MSTFEEAMHHGFSRADLAQEIKEMEERIDQLGCNRCIHRFENSHVCDQIIRHPERWSECKFKFEEERK